MKYEYNQEDLDYSVLPKHIATLQILSEIGNSGVNIFDVNKKEIAFFSPNFGKLLGYSNTDYADTGHLFFDQKIHPEDKLKMALNSISIFKIFDRLTSDEKLNHKSIYEYRMMNAAGKYIRLIDQYQILELDPKGQIWLMFGIVDISPNQDENEQVKCHLLNFRTGNFIPLETPLKPELYSTPQSLDHYHYYYS